MEIIINVLVPCILLVLSIILGLFIGNVIVGVCRRKGIIGDYNEEDN